MILAVPLRLFGFGADFRLVQKPGLNLFRLDFVVRRPVVLLGA